MIDRAGFMARYMALVILCEGASFALDWDSPLGRDIPFTDEEKRELQHVLDEAAVVLAGCKCNRVLLGHYPGKNTPSGSIPGGPGCRLCNVQA